MPFIFWLGWLRTSETFSLTFDDIDYVPVARAAERDLPTNVSMLNFSLLEETKSDRTKKVDVCCTGTTKGGFSLEKIALADMFPQTVHCEVVSLFVRTGGGWSS